MISENVIAALKGLYTFAGRICMLNVSKVLPEQWCGPRCWQQHVLCCKAELKPNCVPWTIGDELVEDHSRSGKQKG